MNFEIHSRPCLGEFRNADGGQDQDNRELCLEAEIQQD